MPTIFTRIIDGELPAAFVLLDDRCAVFMAKDPLTQGHALVVPRVEIDHWVDLDDELLAHLTGVARRVGAAQQRAFSVERIGIIVAGYEVPHVHLHVIPTNAMSDFDFSRATRDAAMDGLEAAASAIRDHLSD